MKIEIKKSDNVISEKKVITGKVISKINQLVEIDGEGQCRLLRYDFTRFPDKGKSFIGLVTPSSFPEYKYKLIIWSYYEINKQTN